MRERGIHVTIKRQRNRRRWKKLTGPIVLIGGSGDSADLRYASGYSAVDPAIFVQHGKRKWLVVPVLERGRACREVHSDVKVLTSFDLELNKQDRRRLSKWIEAVVRKERQRRVMVSAWCPAGIVERLRKDGLKVDVSREPLFPGRAIKNAAEIAAIQEAQGAAVHAYKSAVRFLKRTKIAKNGMLKIRGRAVTSKDVRLVIDRALLERDCIGSGTIVACGSQGADPHERGSGPLKANQPIVLDIFPQHRKTGYWGDLSRTVVRGRAGGKVQKMFRAVRAAHAAALRDVRDGVPGNKVYDTACKVLAHDGFETRMAGGRPEGFIHSLGHGVGLDIHEGPAVGPTNDLLRSGNVITIEPGLYYRKTGGMRIEDTVVVTKTGYRLLQKAPVQLEI